MAYETPKCFRVNILFLIAFSHIFCSKIIDGRISSTSMTKNHIIESGDGSYVIDCVGIDKQPAFSHPLLKNHTIQKRPISSPSGFRNKVELFQSWQKYGKCQKGTIPIARTQLFNHTKTSGFMQNGTHLMQCNGPIHEYVAVSASNDPYYGIRGNLNTWNPTTSNGEFSLSQIWVTAGEGQDLNTLEAGWQVYPAYSGIKKPWLFIYWTRDGYQSTGCYNHKCPGFVQTSSKIALGADLSPVTTYGSQQFELQLTVHKDISSGHWWLKIGNEELGYWPSNILTSLVESSGTLTWGGEIVNLRINGKHTSTQMGSGHFSNEGYRKAAYVGNLGYVDSSGAVVDMDPRSLSSLVTNAACYDLRMGENDPDLGVHFFFGGSGYSEQCP